MRWGIVLVLGLLLASASFSNFAVEWTKNIACFSNVDADFNASLNKCLSVCNKKSIFDLIISMQTRSQCIDDCKRNLESTTGLVDKFANCRVGCNNRYANNDFAACHNSCINNVNVSLCMAGCVSKMPSYPLLTKCSQGCASLLGPANLLTKRDIALKRCADTLTGKISDKKGFLYLPFNTTKGFNIHVGWNYTNSGGSCGSYTSASFHGAVDLDIDPYTDNIPVLSAAPGNVTLVVKDCGKCTSGYGAHVKIRSKDPSTNITYLIVYGHLQNMSVAVEKNQTVGAGEYLGLLGTTGDSTGPHLHFEVRKNEDYGNRVDPYDIRSIDECDYPGWSDSFENVTCGQNFLWTECPPVPR